MVSFFSSTIFDLVLEAISFTLLSPPLVLFKTGSFLAPVESFGLRPLFLGAGLGGTLAVLVVGFFSDLGFVITFLAEEFFAFAATFSFGAASLVFLVVLVEGVVFFLVMIK